MQLLSESKIVGFSLVDAIVHLLRRPAIAISFPRSFALTTHAERPSSNWFYFRQNVQQVRRSLLKDSLSSGMPLPFGVSHRSIPFGGVSGFGEGRGGGRSITIVRSRRLAFI
jgi:hypothetical protein